MYRKTVPCKDYNGKPRNVDVAFMLEVRDVFKIAPELKAIFDWQDSMQDGEPRDLSLEEMREFFNNFETVLLSAWGRVTPDGLGFDRTDKYEFEQSKAFAAFMEMLLSDITEVQKILTEIMPEGMEDIVRKQGESLQRLADNPPEGADPDRIAQLEKRIAELQSGATPPEASAI